MLRVITNVGGQPRQHQCTCDPFVNRHLTDSF